MCVFNYIQQELKLKWCEIDGKIFEYMWNGCEMTKICHINHDHAHTGSAILNN